jgi:hypothetical protein
MREDPSNNMTDLAGKTALITGSTSGIGKPDKETARSRVREAQLRPAPGERCSGRSTFIHCDGAVRGFAPDEVIMRRTETMPTTTRAARYRKVFRIDGTITTEEWSQIATKWYQGNRLVEEYLANLGQDDVGEDAQV